jgi:hypothetical protein
MQIRNGAGRHAVHQTKARQIRLILSERLEFFVVKASVTDEGTPNLFPNDLCGIQAEHRVDNEAGKTQNREQIGKEWSDRRTKDGIHSVLFRKSRIW